MFRTSECTQSNQKKQREQTIMVGCVEGVKSILETVKQLCLKIALCFVQQNLHLLPGVLKRTLTFLKIAKIHLTHTNLEESWYHLLIKFALNL